MSAYYLTLLSLNFAVFTLAAGGVGAIYQLAPGAGGTGVSRFGGRPVQVFLGLALVNVVICIIGAVFLASDHDLVPGVDLQADDVLAAPITGLLVGALTVANGVVAVRAVRHALSSATPAR
jgi:hypothetical protein